MFNRLTGTAILISLASDHEMLQRKPVILATKINRNERVDSISGLLHNAL